MTRSGNFCGVLMLCGFFVTLSSACAEDAARVKFEVMVTGLEHPWSMVFLPDGDLLVTERVGRMRVIRDGRLMPAPVRGLPEVTARGQGGLLDVVLHPGFAANRMLYVSYVTRRENGDMTLVVGCGRFVDDRLEDFTDVLVADAWSRRDIHFGGRLLFDQQGFLYVTVGDRGQRDAAHNAGNHQGTTLRLHDDGSVPADNPYADDVDGAPAVWSYGHRNAQGMAIHPDTGAIWQHEHGPRGGDEVNILTRGGNYGWPLATHGREYYGPRIGQTRVAGTLAPRGYWTPSIAPSGMAFYTAERFPSWQGSFFVGALAGRHLRRIRVVDDKLVTQEVLLPDYGRMRDVRQGPDGFLYVLTDDAEGQLLKVGLPD